MAATPTEPAHNPVFRTIDLAAEARTAWGSKWNAPEISWTFSNGRDFELRTGDAAIYASSPDHG